MKKHVLISNTLALILIISTSCYSQPNRLFTGGSAKSGEKGFNIIDLNPDKGKYNLVSSSDAGQDPTYFCFSKKYGYIYAANEVSTFNGINGGGVTTLNYNPETGVAEKIGELAVPKGGPCFISITPGEDYLLFANYSSASIAVVKLNTKGMPEKVTDNIIFREEGKTSHPHMISYDPSGKRIYVTDLGLDRIVIYTLDRAEGKLHQIRNGIANLAQGAGPRHFVFNAAGTRMYVICELNSTVSVFNVSEGGELSPLQTLTTLAEGFKGESFCADIHIGKNGKYLYGSNRGENTIVTYSISSNGTLALAGRTECGGNWPRNFVIDPSGKFILVGNERSGNISLFRINEKTGIPEQTGNNYRIAAPMCLRFLN